MGADHAKLSIGQFTNKRPHKGHAIQKSLRNLCQQFNDRELSIPDFLKDIGHNNRLKCD